MSLLVLREHHEVDDRTSHACDGLAEPSADCQDLRQGRRHGGGLQGFDFQKRLTVFFCIDNARDEIRGELSR
jgi:hypothetical protein